MRDTRGVESGNELVVVAGARSHGDHDVVAGDLTGGLPRLHADAGLGEAIERGGGQDLDAEFRELAEDAGRTGRAEVGARALGHLEHGDLFAGGRQRIGDLQTHQSAANHDDALALDRFAFEHGVGDVDVGAGESQRDGGGAVGDDHAVEAFNCDGLGRERGVQTHLDAGTPRLFAHERRSDFHLAFAGCLAGGDELATQTVARLEDHGLVPAGDERLGGHQARNAAAHDGDALGLIRHLDLPVELVTDEWVAQAGDVLEVAHVGEAVQASLVAADTVDDAVGLSRARLVAELGVGELGSAHNHEVDLVLLEDLLGDLRGVDTSDADGGHAGLAADACRVVDVEARCQVDGRNLEGIRGGDDIAAGDVEHVDAGFARHLAERDRVLNAHAALEAVVMSVDAHEQGHILRDVLADRADAGEWELGAILQAASPFVAAVVEARGEEGVREVIVGAMEFDAVIARLHAARRGGAVAVDDLVDLLDGDAGDGEAVDGHLIGGENLGRRIHGDGDGSLPELDADAPALGVDGVGEALVALDEAVLGQRQEAVGGAGCVDRGDLDD